MRLRFGVGKRVGPFFFGVTTGGKQKKTHSYRRNIKITVKSPPSSPAVVDVNKKRWRDSSAFWYVLCGLIIVSFPSGFFVYAADGYETSEIISLIMIAVLAVFFFCIARKKSVAKNTDIKTANLEYSDTKEPNISATPPAPLDDMDAIDGMDGHRFEHFCAGLLSDLCFVNVRVTQASNDQGVDILAEKDGIKYAIQCKNYASPLGNTPVQEVHTGKQIYGCQIGVVLTNSSFTQGARLAADSTGVLLWDRVKLAEMLRQSQQKENSTQHQAGVL